MGGWMLPSMEFVDKKLSVCLLRNKESKFDLISFGRYR